MTCPICTTPLLTHPELPQGGHCTTCGGHLLPFTIVRREAPAGALEGLWGEFLAAPVGQRACPTCKSAMRAVFRRGIEVDGCVQCHHVWLDPGEREGLTSPPRVGPRPHETQTMSEAEAIGIVAEVQSKAIGERYAREERLRQVARWLNAVDILLW
jgi:Zn-finger nucleic acid-binding protein